MDFYLTTSASTLPCFQITWFQLDFFKICYRFTVVPDAEATPQNLQAHSYVSDTFITLSWPHVFMNGTRRGYRVNYRKVSDAGSEIKDSRIEAITFSGNTTEAIIPGLDVYSKYCFQLFALNENFPSKPSNSVCAGKGNFLR